MARVVYAARALADLDRLTDFLLQAEPAAALEAVDLITEAVQVLGNHPLIGRVAKQGLRTKLVGLDASLVEQRQRGAALLVEQRREQMLRLHHLVVAPDGERLSLLQRHLEGAGEFVHAHDLVTPER